MTPTVFTHSLFTQSGVFGPSHIHRVLAWLEFFLVFFFFFFFSGQRGRSHITETWLVREMIEIWTPAASWNTVLNDGSCCWDRRRDLRVMVLRIKRRFNRCFCCSLCINTAVSLQTENEIGSFYWNHQCFFPRLTPEWLSKLNRKKKSNMEAKFWNYCILIAVLIHSNSLGKYTIIIIIITTIMIVVTIQLYSADV